MEKIKKIIDNKKLYQCYSDWSKTYDKDAVYNAAIIKDHPVFVKLLKNKKNINRLLDLGCGTGILTQKISKFTKEIYAIDINKDMINIAQNKKYGSKIFFKNQDILQGLDFPDNYFDVIISSLVLSHIENLDDVYQEISRVIKIGGIFIFDEMTPELNKPFKSIKFHDFLIEHAHKGYAVWMHKNLNDHFDLLKKYNFKIEKIMKTYIDSDLNDKIDNFKINKGCLFSNIIQAKKLL